MRTVRRNFHWFAVIIAIGIAWCGYVELRRAYWDYKVKAWCAEDGGVKVFERVVLDDPRYLDAEKNVRIPPIFEENLDYPPLPLEAKLSDAYFKRTETKIIRDDAPRVGRSEVQVFRASDKKMLGKEVSYGRSGGDLFVVDHHSSFRCPSPLGGASVFKSVFIVK